MSAATRTAPDFVAARRAMIDSQLRTSGVNEPFVLERMAAVPREDFVPAAARGVAYMDRAVPLGDGRFLAPPVVHGRTLGEAHPELTDRVLVVDGGSGYLPELVRPLVGALDVITPEEAVAPSRKRGDYTLVLIDGAVEQWPEALTRRMAEGARAVTGIVDSGVTRLAIGRKAAGGVPMFSVAEIGIPVLHAFDRPKGWTF
ncbi:MAG: protein-L-isoaspartate O-methyltransferase family protein [Tsuneonella sp.]